jgi:hypothetical protein
VFPKNFVVMAKKLEPIGFIEIHKFTASAGEWHFRKVPIHQCIAVSKSIVSGKRCVHKKQFI